jgi:hypothetical protein
MDSNPNGDIRTTATSSSEGRLIVDVSGNKKKKSALKALIKKKKDGKGGPGDILPSGTGITDVVPSSIQQNPSLPALTPGRGITITPNTYSPQQQSQMASLGMSPMSSMQHSSGGKTAAPPAFARLSSKPHSTRINIRPPRMKKMKAMKIQSLRSAVRSANKKPKLVL